MGFLKYRPSGLKAMMSDLKSGCYVTQCFEHLRNRIAAAEISNLSYRIE